MVGGGLLNHSPAPLLLKENKMEKTKEQLEEKGIILLPGGRIAVKDTEEHKDLRRMLKELTE